MGGLFSADGPLLAFLNVIADLVILNILMIIFMSPLMYLLLMLSGFLPFTFLGIGFSVLSLLCGAPVCALHYCVIRRVRGEEGALLGDYFKSYKDNFKQGNLLWTGLIFAFFIFFMDMRLAALKGDEPLFLALQLLLGVILLLLFMIFLYAFPLQARFVSPVKSTVKNALLLALISPPRTMAQAVLFLLMPGLYYVLGIGIFPLLLLFGFSLPAYLRARLYVPVFRRLEEEKEE